MVILARCTGTGVLSTMELAEKPEKQLCMCGCQSGTQKRESVKSVEAAAMHLTGSWGWVGEQRLPLGIWEGRQRGPAGACQGQIRLCVIVSDQRDLPKVTGFPSCSPSKSCASSSPWSTLTWNHPGKGILGNRVPAFHRSRGTKLTTVWHRLAMSKTGYHCCL